MQQVLLLLAYICVNGTIDSGLRQIAGGSCHITIEQDMGIMIYSYCMDQISP